MNSESTSLATASKWLAGITATFGLIVLTGWQTGSHILITGIPGSIVVLPWTALAFMLGGGSLWLQSEGLNAPRSNWRARAAVWMAVGILAIGVVMGIQRIAGLDWPINRMLFYSALAPLPYRPVGLMATNSTVCMTLLGAGLLLLTTGRRHALRETLAALSLLIAFVSVLGHTYGVSSLYSLDTYAGMAPLTTLCFVLLSIGLLLCRPNAGFAALLTGKSGSAIITRRLLIASILLPAVFGRLWLAARRADLISRELGVSLFVALTVVVFLALVFWSASALRVSESIRELARSEAERANNAKSEFLAVMSHELRTPLNAIRGYAELLELGIGGPLTEAQAEHVNRIKKSEGHLLALIDDLLNYTQIESGRITFDLRELRLKPLIDEAFLLTEPRARAKGIELLATYDGVDGDYVRADSEKLLQILLNLISNSIKFSEAGGKITLACSSADSPGGRISIVEVRDSGKGIPSDKLDLIFEPFVQIDRGLTRSTDGVGLGLAISRTLARAMSGEITAISGAGSGSVFRVSMPSAQPPKTTTDS